MTFNGSGLQEELRSKQTMCSLSILSFSLQPWLFSFLGCRNRLSKIKNLTKLTQLKTSDLYTV